MTHETFREQLPLYVIGALDGDELLQFERYVAENRERCETEIAEFQVVADQLALGAPQASPSRAVFHRMMAAIEEESPAQPRVGVRPEREREGLDLGALMVRWIPWAATAAACVLLLVTSRRYQDALARYSNLEAQSVQQRQEISDLNERVSDQAMQLKQAGNLAAENDVQRRELESLRSANAQLANDKAELMRVTDDLRQKLEKQNVLVASVEQRLSVLTDPAIRVGQMTHPKKETPAVARVYWNDTKKTGYVFASNLAPVVKGGDKCLELWVICGNEAPVPAGIGWTDDAGHGAIEIKLAKQVACADKFAVTVEPTGGVSAPTGPMVLLGQ